MITYSSSRPWDLVRWRGSVAPQSLKWAIPSAALAALYHHTLFTWTDWSRYVEEVSASETTGWGMFTSILGFLVVFRAQLSYSRYWEGITLVEQACGVWLNGCSNLIAFCSAAPEKQEAVQEFQYLLSRLASLLVCYSMCDISSLDRSRFPHLDTKFMDPSSLEYLEATSAKQNVALQWMQRLVVENARTGVIDIAPPILSRVFQEFSIGIVHFIDANKISTVPFPFEFAQMVWIMLVFCSLVPVPLLCAIGMGAAKAACYTFGIVFVFWSVHFIAVEIELPFGDDPNDLPLDKVNHRFNKVLQRLLDAKAQQTPSLTMRKLPPRLARKSTMCEIDLGASPYEGQPSPHFKEERGPLCVAVISDSLDSFHSTRDIDKLSATASDMLKTASCPAALEPAGSGHLPPPALQRSPSRLEAGTPRSPPLSPPSGPAPDPLSRPGRRESRRWEEHDRRRTPRATQRSSRLLPACDELSESQEEGALEVAELRNAPEPWAAARPREGVCDDEVVHRFDLQASVQPFFMCAPPVFA